MRTHVPDIRLVGGPFPTVHPLLARALASEDPPWFCGLDGDRYVHYRRTGVGLTVTGEETSGLIMEYTYAGLCSEIDHGGACPHGPHDQ